MAPWYIGQMRQRMQIEYFCAIMLSLVLWPALAFGPRSLVTSGPQLESCSCFHAQGHPRNRSKHVMSTRINRSTRNQLELKANVYNRAQFISAAAGVASALVATSGVRASQAEEVSGPPVQAAVEEFVDFMDSRRLFSCRVPASFLRAERNKDRRGTVFVAGDYNKAEVLSVQVVSAYDLLTGAGLPTIGDLSKWEKLGKPSFIAELLKQRRDSDAAGGTQVESVVLPGTKVDGDVLQFTIKSPIKVMRTDLLEKERGVNELYRNTLAKAIMRGDGTFLVVWAGALNTDWDQEGGGKNRLREAVDSFRLEGLTVKGVRLGSV